MAKNPPKAPKAAAPQTGTQEGQAPEGAEQDQPESAQAGSDETTDTEPQAGPEAGSETPEAGPEAESEVATEAVKMVTVTAPRGFNLRLDDHTVLAVKAGVQEMPEHLATHWYAVANGVTVYNPEA